MRLGGRQREALELLAAAPDGIETLSLADRDIGSTTLTRLAALGLVDVGETSGRIAIRSRTRRRRRPPGERAEFILTAEQDAALNALRELAAAGEFKAALLHGVTGSGKTELYLRLAADVRRAGRGRSAARARDRAHAGCRADVSPRVRRARRDSA